MLRTAPDSLHSTVVHPGKACAPAQFAVGMQDELSPMSDTEPQMQPDDAGEADAGAEADQANSSNSAKITKIKTRRGHLPRRISAWVLVVLASILIPVSVMSV